VKKFDLQDALLLCGFVSFEAGVAAISWPWALILAGMICFGFALLIERAKVAEAGKKKQTGE
jgi:hypothetical protein